MTKLAWSTVLLLIGLSSALAQTNKPGNVLFLVGGLYHDYDQLPRTLIAHLQAQLESSLPVTFTISKDVSALNIEELSKYDAVMMNVCEQTPLSVGERTGLLDAVRNGLPLIALHCTFWSFQDWPEFKQLVGAFVPGHDRFGPFCLETAQTNSAVLKGVDPKFQLTDEPYIVNDRDPSMHVLVRTCTAMQDRSGPEPEVWTKMFGKGRIFAMTFGHDASAQQDPNYLKLLTNGLLWALGRSN